MAATRFHPLSSALGLALPVEAGVRSVPQGLAAEQPAQGWRLTAFQRPATPGASAEALHAAVLASVARRYPDSVAAETSVPARGTGWQGLLSTLSTPGGRQIRVLSCIDAATEASLLLGVVLEAAAESPAAWPAAWLQSMEAAPAATPAPARGGLQLSLVPIESEAAAPAAPSVSAPQAPPAPTGLPLSLLPIESQAAAPAPAAPGSLQLSLIPIESDAAPAAPAAASRPAASSPEPVAMQASEPAAARARFGAREPVAGPVAALPGSPVRREPPTMPAANPYQPPETHELEIDAEADPEALRAAGRGQRILVWCVLLNFATRGIARNPEIPMFVNWAIAVGLMIWAFHGVLLIASGFGYGRGAKLGLMFGSTVPLLGIGLWIWLSMKTTRALKAAGHTVGFFGVKS